MANKEKQQELPQTVEATRLAVAISRGANGKWLIEDLRLAGDKVAKSTPLTTLDGTKGVRVVAGTFANMVDMQVQEWQKEGLLK